MYDFVRIHLNFFLAKWIIPYYVCNHSIFWYLLDWNACIIHKLYTSHPSKPKTAASSANLSAYNWADSLVASNLLQVSIPSDPSVMKVPNTLRFQWHKQKCQKDWTLKSFCKFPFFIYLMLISLYKNSFHLFSFGSWKIHEGEGNAGFEPNGKKI